MAPPKGYKPPKRAVTVKDRAFPTSPRSGRKNTRISVKQWEDFDRLVGQYGWSIAAACRECSIGRTTAHAHMKNAPRNGQEYQARHYLTKIEPLTLPDPIPYEYLDEAPRRAHDDFGYFREYYFGRRATPWQSDAAHRTRDLLASPHDEYVVLNCPPGSGKSTTFTHDLTTWLILRNRAIRVQIGSRTKKQASYYSLYVRRTLERPYIMDGAKGCLAQDFGRFQPTEPEMWQNDAFLIAQPQYETLDHREPTVMAISEDMAFLGGRADLIVWDDLVDEKNTRTLDMREKLREWWKSTAETRLEPGGCLLLVGQRLGPDDLYGYCLDMALGEDEDTADDGATEAPRKYTHIVYPAHVEELCTGEHKDAQAWPDGCLLDPARLSWRKLSMIRTNDPGRYEITYQQKDVAPGVHLVDQLWLDGGRHPETHEEFVGCLDHDRQMLQVPPCVRTGRHLSVVSVDPSPTKFWAIEWWISHPDTKTQNLIFLKRRKMGAPDFLDRLRDGTFVGEMEDLWFKARNMGFPITHLIVERNVAQRFMLQYDFFQDWLRQRKVTLVPHDTHAQNKGDSEYGVQMLAPEYRFGRVRLPWHPIGRQRMKVMTEELTRWPEGSTDDCVMAHWFFAYRLSSLAFQGRERVRVKRPSWILGRRVA